MTPTTPHHKKLSQKTGVKSDPAFCLGPTISDKLWLIECPEPFPTRFCEMFRMGKVVNITF